MLAPYLCIFSFWIRICQLKFKIWVIRKVGLFVLKRSAFEPRSQRSKRKNNRSSHAWENLENLPKYRHLHNKAQYRQIYCGFWKFSRLHELQFIFCLLDRTPVFSLISMINCVLEYSPLSTFKTRQLCVYPFLYSIVCLSK